MRFKPYFRQVEPGASVDYAWDDPQAARRLRCVLEGYRGAGKEPGVHSYSLDEIRASFALNKPQSGSFV